MTPLEPVIGLEIHAQLRTATKIFCGCATRFEAPPNSELCPVCLGLPGALPVLNARAVEYAVRAAMALGCDVQPVSVFARKHYFYPDLPKGYQISQYDRPLATGGSLAFGTAGGGVRLGITRVHMEEDAGKSIHDGVPDSDRWTFLDFNRSGVPLIEIVTEPGLRSAADAAEAFSRVREILVAVGVSDGNMEEGSLRCDANISLRPVGARGFGVKTELKNLNSFRHVQRALEYEIERQAAILAASQTVVQQTRLWDQASGETILMRTKEEADDYRYFPEPDLPPLRLDPAWLAATAATIPELPEARRRRLVADYGIPAYDAGVLTQSMPLADYFEQTAAASRNPKAASNWVMGELMRMLKETGDRLDDVRVTPAMLGGLIALLDAGTISGPIAKDVFARMYSSGRQPDEIVASEGLARIDDAEAIDRAVAEVLARHAPAVADYRAGKAKTFGFLVGQVMKALAGKGDPARINASVKRFLDQP